MSTYITISSGAALLLSLSLVACGDDDGDTRAADAGGFSSDGSTITSPATGTDSALPVRPATGTDGALPSPVDAGVDATRPASSAEASVPLDATTQVDAAALLPDSSLLSDSGSDAAIATPGKDGYLLVAELAAGKEAIHAYSLPDLRRTGQLDGVRLGNHLGAIALADGRIVTSDDKNQQLIAIRVDATGKPTLAQRVNAELGTGGVWGCGDADLKYLAVSSGREGNGPQVANVLTLADFSVKPLEVPMNVIQGATEELHPAIAGNPLHLFAGVGAEVRAYPLDAVLSGAAPAPVANVAIHPGSHGPVVSHARGVLYITTAAGTGFDGVNTQAPFTRVQLVPWDVGDRTTGRNSRPRLSADGRYIYGAINRTEPSGAELWAAREVDLQAVDLETRAPVRTLLTTGIVSKFQLSRRYALFANITADKDYAILVDVAPGSSTMHQTVAKIELPRLANGPVAGQPTTGKEARASAITPDGRWAFVSHGGEGKISVIDTNSKAVVSTVSTPSSLAGGGYLFAYQPGATPLDTCTR
jgi:hypothetical protein